MIRVFLSFWPLFFGLGMIGLNSGMQSSLLGIRASLENFNDISTGLMMSSYFAGYFIGAIYIPGIIIKVGHIRTFGAFGSLVSTAILVHAYFVDPWTWSLMRFITGISMMAIYLVAESWLNADSTNETRGMILSFYTLIVYAGCGMGQFFLNLGNPAGYELFVIISIIASLSMIPILLTATRTPSFSVPDKIRVVDLYKVAPLGVLGSLFNNCINAMLLGMGAVYATKIGLTLPQTSLFMAIMLFSGVLLLWPIGKISDRIDRRIMIFTCSLIGTSCAVIGALFCTANGPLLLLVIALIGGFCLPLYSLCIAHTNDYLSPEQTVSAAATILLIAGIGLVTGPIVTATFMKFFGSQGFFWSLALPCGAIVVITAWRIFKRAPATDDMRSELTICAPASVVPVMELQTTDANEDPDVQQSA